MARASHVEGAWILNGPFPHYSSLGPRGFRTIYFQFGFPVLLCAFIIGQVLWCPIVSTTDDR